MRTSTAFLKKVFKNKKLKGAEIGVLKGENAISIKEALNMERLYLIDIWDEYLHEEKTKTLNFFKYYEGVKKIFKDYKNVIIIRGDSIEVAKTIKNNSLDFVYIDGNHDYEFVKKDIDVWYHKVKKGGYICGDDYCKSWKGVIKAVNEFIEKNNFKLISKHKEGDWWFQK